MFSSFKREIQGKKKGTKVRFFLKTGKEKIGIVEEINDSSNPPYLIVKTEQGTTLKVFDGLLLGYEFLDSISGEPHPAELSSRKNTPAKTISNLSTVKPPEILDQELLNRINGLLTNFYKNIITTKLKIKPPDFSFPLQSLKVSIKKRNEIKKKGDKISSQYHNYFKNKNLTQFPALARELKALGKDCPELGIFHYNAGCLTFILGSDWYSDSLKDFEKAYEIEKKSNYIFNIACSALELKKYEKAHDALYLYFNKITPSTDIKTWYVFCNLTKYVQRYDSFKKIFESHLKKIGRIDIQDEKKFYDDFDLLFRSLLFLLKENNKSSEIIQILPLLNKEKIDYNMAIKKINSCFKSLSQIPNQLYDIDLEQKPKSEIIVEPKPKYKIELPILELERKERNLKLNSEPKTEHESKKEVKIDKSNNLGFIFEYNKERGFGFIKDNRRNSYFFHITAIIDKDLKYRLVTLKKSELETLKKSKIPVFFEEGRGPRGPIAFQISMYGTIDEMYRLAISYADAGYYNNAIYYIKKVMSLDPDYLNASEYYEKWREYERVRGVPSGSNPYARAKRAELVEKDLEKSERIFREAIAQNDNPESAIKDLVNILIRLNRPQEAIELLIKNRKQISNNQSYEYILINLYKKTREYDLVIELLSKELNRTSDSEIKAKILYQIGNIYLNLEEYKKAEDFFNKVLKLDENNKGAKHNIALSLSKQGYYDEAEAILNKILDTSPDNRAAELLEATVRARTTGISNQVDDIIIETSLSDFSGELSFITQFFLDFCNFQGVTPDRVKEDEQNRRRYVGSKKDAKDDIESLVDAAETFTTRNPRYRGNYYLSAARISYDVRDREVSDIFFRYLGRSFYSKGDAAIIENRHVDVARTWYCESLNVYDGGRSGVKSEQDASNALIRFLYSGLGPSQIPMSTKIPSLAVTLNEILNRHPQREKIFDHITYLILYSRYAANRILNLFYEKDTLQPLALQYLKDKQISVPASVKRLDDFIALWNKLRRNTFEKLRFISNKLKFFNRLEMTTSWLEDAIEQVKGIEDILLFDLDQQRALILHKLLETALELCKQITFEERERLSQQIEIGCNDLKREIEESPTKLSIEEFYPIIEKIRKKVSEGLELLYETSIPQLTLRLPEDWDSYVSDNNQEIIIQIVIKNETGRSPAESLELIIQEDENFFAVKISSIKLDKSLRGSEQCIIEVPLRVTERALESKTFSLPVYAQYRTRMGEVQLTNVENFSIRLYPEEEFMEIDNPYAAYAEGGIVDDLKMFKGREELIENLKLVIEKSHGQSKCLIIFGQKRSGKSSILYHLKSKLEENEDMLILDIGNIGLILDELSHTPFLYQILWSILGRLKDAIEDKIDKGYSSLKLSIPMDLEFYDHPSPLVYFKDIFDRFKHLVSKSDDWKSVRIVLLIDEFSYIYGLIINKKIPKLFMKNWKAILQANYFNAVLAGQDVMPKFKKQFPNEFGTTQDERVSYLKRDHAIELIDEPIRIGGRDGESRYRERAIQQILELTAGNPFYIQIICNRLVEYMNRKHIIYVTEANVGHVKNELISGVNALSLDKFDNLINSGDESEDSISDKDVLKVLKQIAINSKTGPCSRNSIACETSKPLDIILDDLKSRDVIECEREYFYKIKVELFKEWLLENG